MGPLEVVRTLHENNIETERPIVICDWTNEEGSRFAPAMVSSGVWAGALERDWAYDRTDINGLRFEDELVRLKETADIEKRREQLAELLAFLGADPVEKVDDAFKEKYQVGILEFLELKR